MLNSVQLGLLLSGVLLWCVVASQTCTSCGPECVPACGSRRYRTCCFNYLRKRRSSTVPGAPTSAPQQDPVQLEFVVVPGAGHFFPLSDENGNDYPKNELSYQDYSIGQPSVHGRSSLPQFNLHQLLANEPKEIGESDKSGTHNWVGDLRRRMKLAYNY